MDNKICITMIGTGYVGLVSGACFAELGWRVACIDKDIQKIKALQQAQVSIYEMGLEALVRDNLNNKQLIFDSSLKSSIEKSQVLFIAVGTPTHPETGQADLSHIEMVAEELAPLLTDHKFIVVKSTVPVGTGRHIKNIILKIHPNAKFDLISNPEFLREGSAVGDFMQPDRIIIGSETQAARRMMDKLYQPLLDRNTPILHTDIETAEMIKYAANCFLATKIAFTNEIADLCEKFSANVEDVMFGMGLDKRIGSGYLKPGPGFGGSCFPKDTQALAYAAQAVHSPLSIINAVIRSNEKRKNDMISKIILACGGQVEGKTLAVLGFAFKANTDDIRESAALTIVRGLQANGASIRGFDPVAMKKASEILSNVFWAKDPYEAAQDADALVIVTEWEQFTKLDLKRIKNNLNTQNGYPPTIIDLRNLYVPESVAALGLRYLSLGRPVLDTLNFSAVNPETKDSFNNTNDGYLGSNVYS